MCEKRKPETPQVEAAATGGGGGDGDDKCGDDKYERLLGALTTDRLVRPTMLMGGRPMNASRCVEALRR